MYPTGLMGNVPLRVWGKGNCALVALSTNTAAIRLRIREGFVNVSAPAKENGKKRMFPWQLVVLLQGAKRKRQKSLIVPEGSITSFYRRPQLQAGISLSTGNRYFTDHYLNEKTIINGLKDRTLKIWEEQTF